VYLAVVLFGAAAVLFPLHVRRARRLAATVPTTEGNPSVGLSLYGRAIGWNMFFSLVFFYTMYALLRWQSECWWLIAAAVYTVFAVLLPIGLAEGIIPHLYKPESLPDHALADRVRALANEVGIALEFVGRWTEEEVPERPPVMLAGRGRFLFFDERTIGLLAPDERLALAAREIGGARRHHRLKRVLAGAACATAGFAVVHGGATILIGRGSSASVMGVRDIAAFPLTALCVLIASAIAQTLYRAILRAQVYDADAFAARRVGTGLSIRALQKLLGDPEPSPRWVEWLFRCEPSVRRRVHRLEQRVESFNETLKS
jgi:STE24 endopeptidase